MAKLRDTRRQKDIGSLTTLGGAAVVALLSSAPPARAGEPMPYSDQLIFAAPTGGPVYAPTGASGPTQYGEIHVLRERAFDASTGPAPASGLKNESTWPGLKPANPNADGVYAQSVLVRVGPVSVCGSSVGADYTVTLGPGLTLAGVLSRTDNLESRDPLWGVDGIVYDAVSRGFEGNDSLSVAPPAGTIDVSSRIACPNIVDELRLLIDHGGAWLPDATLTITAHPSACAGNTPCSADINVGGVDGKADPDGDPSTGGDFSVVVRLSSGPDGLPTPAPSLVCPVGAAPGVIGGTAAAGARVDIYVEDPTGLARLFGEAQAGPGGDFLLTADPNWPWPIEADWHIYAVATDENAGLLPSEQSAAVLVEDSDCDGVGDALDCAPLDPAVHAGAVDLCNGVDDDCDGTTDPGADDVDNDNIADCVDTCIDADNDSYGVGAGCVASDCADTLPTCTDSCEDVDDDNILDCADDCVDVDDDGYGVGPACLGVDCADGEPDCAESCVDLNNNGTPDCAEPPLVEADVVEPGPDVVEPESDTVDIDTAEPEPDTVEPEPDTVEPEPDTVEPEPDTVESEPDTVEPKPDTVEIDAVEIDTAEPGPDLTEPDTLDAPDDATLAPDSSTTTEPPACGDACGSDGALGGLRGGGGCSSTSGQSAPGGALLVLLGLLMWRGGARRSQLGWLLAACAGGLAHDVHAQNVDPRRLNLSGQAHDLVGVRGARTLDHLAVDASIVTGWAHDELIGARDGDEVRLINQRFSSDMSVALGLYGYVDVGVSLPVVWASAAKGDARTDSGLGIGALAFDLRGRVADESWGEHRLALSLGVGLGVPVGGAQDLMAHEGVTATPRIALEYLHPRLSLALDAAYVVRSAVTVGDLVVGDDARVGLGVETRLLGPVWALANVVLAVGVESAPDERAFGLEALAGVRWRASWGLSLFGAMGAGLTGGYGVPDIRAVLGLGFSTPRITPVVAAPQEPAPEPEPLVSLACACDASPDTARAAQKAAAAQDPDPDGDGLVAPTDACPAVAEDVDGFQDDDGCPEPDNDLDGVLDADDLCPESKEVVNGVDDPDGCADEGPERVVVGAGGTITLKPIVFETARATLLPSSEHTLVELALALKAHPELGHLRIDGHTDNRGDPEQNVDLSERRVQAVMRFLRERGVAPERMSGKGYGGKRPVTPNTSAAGRAKNRRVDFVAAGEAGTP